MIRFCPLASGSKGNAILVSTPKTNLLIDVGLNKKNIIERLKQSGVSLNQIDGIIITHEHHDHTAGLKTLCKEISAPIFTNRLTAKELIKHLPLLPKLKIFTTGEPFSFQGISIRSFSVQHDTVEPVGLTLDIEGIRFGICTDLGFVTPIVLQSLQKCDYLYVEANHEPSMVHACSRPQVYKNRVLSRLGHLSNRECASLISAVYHDNLKKVYLAHLSSECNSPQKALQIVKEHLSKEGKKSLSIEIAYQDKVSIPIEISPAFS